MEGQREKVWKWVCLECGKRGNRNMRLKNDMAATAHAEKYRGHNVAITRWDSDGPDVLVRVTVSRPAVIGNF